MQQSHGLFAIAIKLLVYTATWKKSLLRPLWGLGATYNVHLRLIGKLVGDFLLVIIELFSQGAFVLSQSTRLTDRISTAIPCVCFESHGKNHRANAAHGPNTVKKMFRDRTEALLDRRGPGPGAGPLL